METVNLFLPQGLKDFVQSEVVNGGFSNTGEYIQELIREEKKRKEKDRLETLLLEGLSSGSPITMTKENWMELKEQFIRRREQTQPQK